MKPPMALLIARCLRILSIILAFAVPAAAQHLIGAKSGVIQYAVGNVFIDGKALRLPMASYYQMDNGQELATKKGYAELMLTPVTYLRVGEDALLRMCNNKLGTTQLKLIQGSALIEVVEKLKTDPVVIQLSKSTIEIKKPGLYRLDSASGDLLVYKGVVTAKREGNKIEAKTRKLVHLDGDFKPTNFNQKAADALDVWAMGRSIVNAYWRNYKNNRPPARFEIDKELRDFSEERQETERLQNAIEDADKQEQVLRKLNIPKQ
jgi:hypothetical protein